MGLARNYELHGAFWIALYAQEPIRIVSRRFGLLQEEKDIPDSLLSDYRLDVAEPRTSLVFLMIAFFEISS